jgi:hypothetical protein
MTVRKEEEIVLILKPKQVKSLLNDDHCMVIYGHNH